jgi:hypothetical protein
MDDGTTLVWRLLDKKTKAETQTMVLNHLTELKVEQKNLPDQKQATDMQVVWLAGKQAGWLGAGRLVIKIAEDLRGLNPPW